jgi:hypothetical protein
MRLSASIALALSLVSLTGCASSFANRGHDTAVRAEPRRVSCATSSDPVPPSFVGPARTWTN